MESKVKEFYDEFSDYQNDIGVNLRHRMIIENLKKIGLNKNSTVLEIGCGIGTLTTLLAKKVTKGTITAVDISPKSIEIAKIRLSKQKNITFLVNDMNEFPIHNKFDIIVLPDVLEHIPLENHKLLFKTLYNRMHESSVICINIPSPFYNDWVRANSPKDLQIIDQSLYFNSILENTLSNNLYIYKSEIYSIWKKEGDYQWLLLRQFDKEQIKMTQLSKFIIVLKRLKHWFLNNF